ncbi:MAG: hypothetical protein ABEN55_15555, partial [Bradymonadaceae bacterium]
EFDPVDLQNEMKSAMKFASLGVPKDSEAFVENIIQAARARFGSRLEPEALESLEEDLRDAFESGGAPTRPSTSPLQGVGS